MLDVTHYSKVHDIISLPNGEGGENMENRQELLDSLVDIRDVKIDCSLPVEERMKSYVEQIKNPYMFKVGNTIVRVSYKKDGPSFQEVFNQMLKTIFM